MLAKRDPAAAGSILARIIRDFDDYETSIAAFRAAAGIAGEAERIAISE